MKLQKIQKPLEGEYDPYTIMYIGLLPDDGLVLEHLKNNLDKTKALIGSLPEDKLIARFAEGEWTIKEILAHIVDDERIYAYRTLRFARNDKTELPGFDQDEFTAYSGANERRVEDILEEFGYVRMATIAMFNSFDAAALKRAGTANGHIMSVRAAAYHIAGHELHHLNSIKQNYLRAE